MRAFTTIWLAVAFSPFILQPAASAQPAAADSGIAGLTRVEHERYKASLNSRLVPRKSELFDGFKRTDIELGGTSEFGGTYSVNCNKAGSPRLFLLPNGLVFEHKGKQILSDAQYTTSTTFGQMLPPKGFHQEYGGNTLTAYFFVEDRQVYAKLGEIDDALYQELERAGIDRLDACADVAGPE